MIQTQPFKMEEEIIHIDQFIIFKSFITFKEKGYLEYKKCVYVRSIFESGNLIILFDNYLN